VEVSDLFKKFLRVPAEKFLRESLANYSTNKQVPTNKNFESNVC
jgi:hypothetical protein